MTYNPFKYNSFSNISILNKHGTVNFFNIICVVTKNKKMILDFLNSLTNVFILRQAQLV